MELRKKIRAKDFAMTHCTPSALMISGACSLEDPHPKFFPATIMSPFWICPASSGRRGLNPYCFISSMVFSARYSVGMMISVSISSPNFQQRPSKVRERVSVFSSSAGASSFKVPPVVPPMNTLLIFTADSSERGLISVQPPGSAVTSRVLTASKMYVLVSLSAVFVLNAAGSPVTCIFFIFLTDHFKIIIDLGQKIHIQMRIKSGSL